MIVSNSVAADIGAGLCNDDGGTLTSAQNNVLTGNGVPTFGAIGTGGVFH